jgi:ABC-type cobalamin/Fe3+-siderophores transport system ATPase subunit
MRISRLRIRNFRSIQELDIPVQQICALVGPNNAGKSNVLEAIRRVLEGSWLRASDFGTDDIFLHDDQRDIEIVCAFDPPLEYVRFKNADPVAIHSVSFKYTKYKVGPNKGGPRLEQQCMDAKGETLSVLARAPKKGEQHRYEPLVGVPSEVRERIPLIYIGTNRMLRDQLPSARYSLLRRLFESVNANFHDPTQTVKVQLVDGTEREVPRLERFRTLMDRAMELLRTDEFKAVERSIKRNALRNLGFDPDVDADKLDLYFTPMDTLEFYKSLDLIVKEGEFAISAKEMGGGMQNAIVLAILQAFEETQRKGAILLIEEPEMFLHPQTQRSLYKTMREIGRTNQIIYATHSPHFVSIPEYSEVLLVRRGEAGTTVQLSALPTNDRRREKFVKELDPERNELFFARRLLIVEGDTEKLAFPMYAARMGIDLDREGATIVEVGGKKNLMEFARIALSFGIPTGIVYDEDSSDFDAKQKEEEETYNASLDALAKSDGSVRVWHFSPRYERHLRDALGESNYQALCQKFPSVGKPTQARLIALEGETPIPKPVDEVLTWLAGRNGKSA